MAEGYTAGMVKHSLRDFSPEAGFEYRMPEKIDPAVARFDITGCPYHAMTAAAVLRCKDQVMRDVESMQENCSDILADAKAINEAKAAEREAAYIEDAAKV